MGKKKIIKQYGERAYEKYAEQIGEWKLRNPTWVQENSRKWNRKGGEYYAAKRKYMTTGVQGERNRIRGKHQRKWTTFKRIIAPESQLHHQWIASTSEYTGLALVEADTHIHGFIDVIQIIEGEITLLTEAEIRGGK